MASPRNTLLASDGSDRGVDGAVNINAVSRFQSAGVRAVFALCREDACWNDPCCPAISYHDSYQTRLLIGYRFLRLDDALTIQEQLTSTSAAADRQYLSFLEAGHFRHAEPVPRGRGGLVGWNCAATGGR